MATGNETSTESTYNTVIVKLQIRSHSGQNVENGMHHVKQSKPKETWDLMVFIAFCVGTEKILVERLFGEEKSPLTAFGAAQQMGD